MMVESYSCAGALQQVDDDGAAAPVEGARRLVRKAEARPLDQGPADSHALLLAAGELGGLLVFFALEAELFQHLVGPLAGFATGHAVAPAQHDLELLPRGQSGEQVVALEDEAAVSKTELFAFTRAESPDVDHSPVIASQHLTAVRREQSREHGQERRLAGAARAHQQADLAAVQLESHVVDDVASASTVAERAKQVDCSAGPVLRRQTNSHVAPRYLSKFMGSIFRTDRKAMKPAIIDITSVTPAAIPRSSQGSGICTSASFPSSASKWTVG